MMSSSRLKGLTPLSALQPATSTVSAANAASDERDLVFIILVA
jgi:hypothetical protein